MTPIITPAHVTSELFLIGFGATFLTAATVWVLWYVHETNFPDDIKDPGFFLTFIIVVVPFVMLIYFGLDAIIDDTVATGAVGRRSCLLGSRRRSQLWQLSISA